MGIIIQRVLMSQQRRLHLHPNTTFIIIHKYSSGLLVYTYVIIYLWIILLANLSEEGAGVTFQCFFLTWGALGLHLKTTRYIHPRTILKFSIDWFDHLPIPLPALPRENCEGPGRAIDKALVTFELLSLILENTSKNWSASGHISFRHHSFGKRLGRRHNH